MANKNKKGASTPRKPRGKKAGAAANNAAFVAPQGEKATVIVPPIEEEKEIVPVKNKVVFELIQDTTKPAKRAIYDAQGVKTGVEEYQKPVVHGWRASFETDEAIETAALSDWIISQLADYQVMQKHQGKARFDTALPITFNMNVNDGGAIMGLKFSTNAKAIEKLFTSNPGVMARVFNPTTSQYTTDAAKRLQNREETKNFLAGNLNVLVAPAIAAPALEVNDAGKLEEVNLGNGELANAGQPVANL
jgi:hypothetical protein